MATRPSWRRTWGVLVILFLTMFPTAFNARPRSQHPKLPQKLLWTEKFPLNQRLSRRVCQLLKKTIVIRKSSSAISVTTMTLVPLRHYQLLPIKPRKQRQRPTQRFVPYTDTFWAMHWCFPSYHNWNISSNGLTRILAASKRLSRQCGPTILNPNAWRIEKSSTSLAFWRSSMRFWSMLLITKCVCILYN